ncbi:YtxH domain-containing protein [Exiguobacterium alkaliphilum]|uniref:YtxH domain-containing protein n=1 Tax=Exiguobacterium alkaliphilum TaxID=1428684 RepID=A0ABT2KUI5_9BACL|nr:YtxH domain-containing protein [Exiguobacterium alkaliphilum]MCT4794039.1 YtxH domain-containing protein [Exiguobacterium alkaliphilum]QUE87609.1 YtxH domain-containing protein [Exiguobacterium alkaliphilum]
MTYDKNNSQHTQQSSGGGFLAGVVLGGVIGAAVALLTSPKSGREVRTYLDEKTATSRERLTVKSKEVREKAEPVVGEWIKVASDKSAPLLEKAAPVLNLVKDKAREAAELKQQVDEDELSIEEAMEKADQLVAEAEAEVKEQLDRAADETSNDSKEATKDDSKKATKDDSKQADSSSGQAKKQEQAKPESSRDESTNHESEFEAPIKDLLDDESKQELKELKQDLKNGKK